MKFDTIRDMTAKDMAIDDSQLDIESLKIPQLHNKYLNIFHDERFALKKLEADKRELLRVKWEFYSGKMSEEDLKSITGRGWEIKNAIEWRKFTSGV